MEASPVRRIDLSPRAARWERQHVRWPGHRVWVVVDRHEVRLGERTMSGAGELSFVGRTEDLAEGLFHEAIGRDLGADALAEIVAAARGQWRDLRAAAPLPAVPAKPPALTSPPRPTTPEPPPNDTAPAVVDGGAAVIVTLEPVPRIDLTLIAALRTVTTWPVATLLDSLRAGSPPLGGPMSREAAEGVVRRLAGHGVRATIRPDR